MSDKEKIVTITIPENKYTIGCLIASIIIISFVGTLSYGFLIFNNTDKIVESSFIIIALILCLVILTIVYISFLEYKEKIFRSTLSVAKVIMALEKQKDNSAAQPTKIEEITIDGKALISIDWPKDTSQNNSNQGNGQSQ